MPAFFLNYDFFAVFLELLPELSDFINSNDSIEKITSKSIEYIQSLLKKDLKSIKNRFF